MQCQNDILKYTRNIRIFASEIKTALRKQLDADLVECDLSDQGTANVYIRELAQLSSLAESIEFRCDCIDKWLPEAATKRPALLREPPSEPPEDAEPAVEVTTDLF
jgi:hypothetical protein